MKKLLASIAILAGMALPSQAQTQCNLYEQGRRAYFGVCRAFNGSHFEIYNNGTVIKTFPNTATVVSSNGVPGVQATIGQWNNSGQHIASGYGQFYQNGLVYLRWTNESTAGVWRNRDSGWRAYQP